MTWDERMLWHQLRDVDWASALEAAESRTRTRSEAEAVTLRQAMRARTTRREQD